MVNLDARNLIVACGNDVTRMRSNKLYAQRRVDLLPHAQLLRWYVRHRDALDGVAELVDAEAAVVVRVEHLEQLLDVLRLDYLNNNNLSLKNHEKS